LQGIVNAVLRFCFTTLHSTRSV